MSSFKSWTRERLEDRFGLYRVFDYPSLLQWLSADASIDEDEKKTLARLQHNLLYYVDYWNEEELKIKFIGNLITLVDFDTEKISAFADRYISAIVDEEELSGNPDLMIARGKQEVKAPFFFLHEYKKELDNDSPDPAGQCLAAMLAAQELNRNVPQMTDKPIRGVYVVGRNWFIMLLSGKEYGVSRAYDATQTDDLLGIFRILKVTKRMILEIWG